MHYDFPDPFTEEVPEQDLLLDSWQGDLGEYLNELQDLAFDMADEQAAGSAPSALFKCRPASTTPYNSSHSPRVWSVTQARQT